MKRILVIGSGGAGKSTFAARLATVMGLPLIHLDAEYWQPGWVEPPKREWADKVEQLIAAECWVMDGNYGGTMEQRLAACDTVIFLDLPRWLCLWRVVKRYFRYRGQARPDMTPGCAEQLTLDFLWWIWNYPNQQRPQILARLALLEPGKRSVVLQSSAEIDTFFSAL